MPDSPHAERAALRERLTHPPTITIDVDGRPLVLTSAWGLFSAKAIDEGTALLLHEVQRLAPCARVLDLGCGYGAIGLTLATLWPEAEVVLADKDVLAVEATQANIKRNALTGATAVLSPGGRDLPDGPYDLIVSNLPAQAGNEAIDQLLLEAHDRLAVGGTLVVVLVAGLRRYIKRRLLALYGNHHKGGEGSRHVLAEATRAD